MRLMSLSGPRAGGHKTEVPMGGNITIQGNLVTHDYIQTANLSVPVTFGGNLMLVGGGGGGGTNAGGGGGAGGLLYSQTEVFPRSFYNVNVGAGGAGATDINQSGAAGGNTRLYYQNTAQITVNGATKIDLANGLHALIWKFDGTKKNFYSGTDGTGTSSNLNGAYTQPIGSVVVSGNRLFVNELLMIGGGNGGGLGGGVGFYYRYVRDQRSPFTPGPLPPATVGNLGFGGAPGSIFYSNNFFLDPGTYNVGVGKGGMGDTGYVFFSNGIGIDYWNYAQTGGASSFGPFVTPDNPVNYVPKANAGPRGTSIYSNLLSQINQYLPASQAIGSLVNGKYIVAAGGGGAHTTTNGIGGTGGLGGGGAGATTVGTNVVQAAGADPKSYGSGGGGNDVSFNSNLTGNGANGIVIMTYFTSGDVFVAHGGGGGASSGAATSTIGGSGGGGAGNATNNVNLGGKSYAVEGNDGGRGITGLAGGGGGSLGYTNSINAQTTAGSGGQATPVDITGGTVYYAGGGGGGASTGSAGAGNESGGGGGSGGSGGPGQAGIDTTGGGGGGNGNTDTSGANRGGSGRAVIKYQTWANQGLRNGIYTCKDVKADIAGDWYTLTFTKNTYLSLHIPVTAEILVVAAGGEASAITSAGGGAGGVIYIPQYSLPAGSYQIKVGQPGGFWGPDGFGVPDTTPGRAYEAAVSGGNSFIRSTSMDINLVALGGGAASYAWSGIGNDLAAPKHPLGIGPVAGGSGGGNGNRGSSFMVGPGTPGAQPSMPGDSGKYGYGNASGALDAGTSHNIASGGGGAGSAGQNASQYGNGGDGILLGITGKQTYYAAGGGGAGLLGGSANGAGWGDVGLVTVGSYRYYGVTNQAYGSGGSVTSVNRLGAAPGIVIIKFNISTMIMGGVKSTIGPYTLHTFRTAAIDGFQNLQDITADILVIGGGGGGGAGAGGGGGAGGYVFQKAVQLPADYYQIKVGAGGLGGNPNSAGNTYNGNNGEDSYLSGNFVTINASGGGGGVGATGFTAGLQGGSGGGGSVNATRQVLSPGIGNGSQGFAGGAGKIMSDIAATGLNFIVSGGGGGAAQAGFAGVGAINTSNPTYISPVPAPGKGGSGLSNDITGTATYYAGGGGGGGSILMIPASGPAPAVPSYPRAIVGGAGTYTTGGGGPGYNITTYNYVRGLEPTTPVLDGLANTGGGGGGGFSKVNYTTRDITNEKAGGNGGSGLVIIRYLTAQPYIAPPPPPAPVTSLTGATGGVKTSANGYIYHTFNTSGTFIPAVTGTVDMLIVAGGGSGGVYYYGGGGGGGGVITQTNFTLTGSMVYNIIVGQGGTSGSNGEDSFVAGADNTTLVANGGGAGTNGYGTGAGPGKTGGSGGGGGSYGGYAGGASTTGQGNAGGQGGTDKKNGDYGGGGGGAGTAGNSGALALPRAAPLGQGGDGIRWLNGITYAGGGGGALDLNAGDLAYFAAGGVGGGGSGANYSSHPAADGAPNTGGGGGGACHAGGNPTPGKGGSGVVIIRYPGTL